MRKPVAVLISDVHYSLSTYDLADKSFRAAIDKAASLQVPLIDCGDLTNDKAGLRAEYVNILIETMLYARAKGVKIYALVGNHSLLNEKGNEHALHFLDPYCTVIDKPGTVDGFNFIPYQTDASKFMEAIQTFPEDETVIGHQGTIGGQLGHYVKDTSAIDPEQLRDWKVYLGHYHEHYELYGTVSIGNPYTLSFGEANQGLKGFLVLYNDGYFTREILDFRRHVILESTAAELKCGWAGLTPTNLHWLKVSGPYSELEKLNKREIGLKLFGHSNYKLDKIYTDTAKLESRTEQMTDTEILDAVIDGTDEPVEQKEVLKALWREVIS